MKPTYDEVLKCINDHFSDTSRSKQETVDNLRTLQEEIEIMIESLAIDLECDE